MFCVLCFVFCVQLALDLALVLALSFFLASFFMIDLPAAGGARVIEMLPKGYLTH